MPALLTSSIVVSFISGTAALFAPCCIGVLLPAYLGSIFKQKTRVIGMTFVFFLGILIVFMPLGVGFAGLGQMFQRYHNVIFISGGLFLILLGVFILLGGEYSLPFSVPFSIESKPLGVPSVASVLVLGTFSGLATLCCAPVLAGVLALSILPGSILWGGVYTFSYVLGMTAPLFFLAYFLDKADFTSKLFVLRKRVSYDVLGRMVSVTPADILAGLVFVGMGVLILYLAKTNQLAMGGGYYQTTVNIYLDKVANFITQILSR